MDAENLQKIRQAEKESHLEVYSTKELYAGGSWLAKPVKTVLELLPLFKGYRDFRALDLGCGVGRNSIALAKAFREIPCQIDCVDILDFAIEKLLENARQHGVADLIRGIVQPIDAYTISPDQYDLILAVSALEHVDSQARFVRKLDEIRDGVRSKGVVCLIVNSNVTERDNITGRTLSPQFEVNLEKHALAELLHQKFAGWEIIKETAVHQKYDVPRETGLAELNTDVVTFAARKCSSDMC